MAEQIRSRRNTVLLASTTFGVTVLGTASGVISDVLDGTTAVAASLGIAAATGGILAYQAVSERREEPAGAAERRLRYRLPDVEPLVGREALLGVLLTLLKDVPTPSRGALPVNVSESQSKIVVVHGAAGIGKTALALTAAHRVKHAYPDGQLYINLRGDGDAPKTSGEALEQLLERLGMARDDLPADVDGRSSLLRSLTNDQRLLILLDNAHSTEQLRPLLPTGAGCSVLITSRKALSAGVTRRKPVPVALPDESEALDVLAHYAGRERIASAPAVALEITRFCDRLPLALRIVGSKLRQRPDLSLSRMRELLEDEKFRLRLLEFEDESLHACLMLTHRDLRESTRAAFGLITSLPVGRVTDWHFEHVVPARMTAFATCDELIEVSLMESQGGEGAGPSYRVHDLVRVFTAEQYEQLPPAEQRQYEARLVKAYRDAAVSLAAQRAPELGAEVSAESDGDLGQASAASWVSAEQERLRWAIGRARSLDMNAEAADIGEALSYFLDDIDLPTGSADWLFDASPSETRSRVLASLRRARASAAVSEGAPDTALMLLVRNEPDVSADPVGCARDEMIVARAYAAKRDFRKALDHMATAADRLRAGDDSWHVLNSLEKLGEFQRWRGSPELAEQSQREALRLAEGTGDRRAQARLRRTLAETLGYLRRPEEAAPLLESAIRDFRALNDRRWEGASLYALGKIYRLLGRRQEARERYDRAEEIFGPMGERHWMGRVTNARIRVLAGMGYLDEAAATAGAALRLFEEIGDEMWQAHTQRDIGWLRIKARQPEAALEPLTHAINVVERAGDAYAGSMARHLRGVAYRELGQYVEAHSDLEAALAVYLSGSYSWNEAAVTHDMVRLLRAEGRTAEADSLEQTTAATNPIFLRMRGRDGVEAVPDED
ncbi:tetratricopeptide repeat protein [Streptomyces sp. CB01373]|uniref:tetratricopeptide repeat protein n=1 Tax=Streptomyces sp. CB01373 TaxID=2020325 RepID=UPI00131BEF20|nr:tetratricopeptide repeat protein [Streptomyces sp. CB01373]